MRNSAGLPIVAIVIGIAMLLLVANNHAVNPGHFNVVEIGAIAAAATLFVYGAMGLISVLVEGRELQPGTTPPHLTGSLSASIAVISLLLVVTGGALAYGIADDWGITPIGLLAGLGCFLMAALFVAYKEGFLGEEARFDRRDDGVPW
jgi:hypothetical protein